MSVRDTLNRKVSIVVFRNILSGLVAAKEFQQVTFLLGFIHHLTRAQNVNSSAYYTYIWKLFHLRC